MEESIPRKRFIKLGAAIGVSTVGASIVAACGGGGGSNGSANQSPETAANGEPGGDTAGSAETGSSGGEVIAQASEVPENSAKKFTDAGNPAVLVHLQNGDFVAYSAVCTHRQCTVNYQDGQLACPCHGSVFDPSSGGQVLQGPAEQPLLEIPVQVQDGEILKA